MRGKLGNRAIDVGQWQRRELAEPRRVLTHHLGAELVDLPRQRAGGPLVSEVHARRGQRQHGTPDPGLVHQVEVLPGGPMWPVGFRHPGRQHLTRGLGDLHIVRGGEVRVHVD
jgi:hypothetical protein